MFLCYHKIPWFGFPGMFLGYYLALFTIWRLVLSISLLEMQARNELVYPIHFKAIPSVKSDTAYKISFFKKNIMVFYHALTCATLSNIKIFGYFKYQWVKMFNNIQCCLIICWHSYEMLHLCGKQDFAFRCSCLRFNEIHLSLASRILK